CDDLAVAVCGDAQMYAQALVGMERLRGTDSAFVFTAARGSLLYRVRRLVGPAPAATPPPWVAGVVVATLLLVLGAGSRLARVSAGFRESSAPLSLVVAPNHVPTAPDTLPHRHESARPPELRPRIARSGVTPPDPQFSSTGLAPLDIRRSSRRRRTLPSVGRTRRRIAGRTISRLSRHRARTTRFRLGTPRERLPSPLWSLLTRGSRCCASPPMVRPRR